MAIRLPAPEQRKWWIIGTIGVLLATAGAVVFGLSATRGISWTTVQYRQVNDKQVSVTFDVVHQDGKPAVCDLHALDFDRNQVGVATVELPASSYDSTRYTRTVPTVTKAVLGEVVECRYK